MHVKTQGVVLREVNYKESDKLLTLLTREGGKRTVKARGCRRKNSPLAASAQLLVYSELTLFEYRDYWVLDEAESLEQFWGLKKDLERLALGSYFAQVMETVAEEGRSDEALLSLILNSLYALDQLPKPLPLVKGAYELKLMALAGYEPLLDRCAACGKEGVEEPWFSLRDGVLCCGGCRRGEEAQIPLDQAALKAMRHVVYGPEKRLFSFTLGEGSMARFGAACEGFLLTQLDRDFHTLDFYRQITGIGAAYDGTI